MALVKKSKIRRSGAGADPKAPVRKIASQAKAAPAIDKVSERIAAATEELASGLSESATAAEELRRSMMQIAAGAEEAAGASQEQLAAVQAVNRNLATARERAEESRRRTAAVQSVLTGATAQIVSSVRAVERNVARQITASENISQLELSARSIGEVAKSVSQISDQTNLLALNAAIEAARAGEQGRGFAVVAEEVRALAEMSERNAGDVQALTGEIQTQVLSITKAVERSVEAANAQAKVGQTTATSFDTISDGMIVLVQGSEATLTAAMEAERAAQEAQRGAELVASASEQQAAAAAQSQAAVEQQSKALEQGQVAAHELAASTAKLGKRLSAVTTEEISAAAEELSGTIQELSGAATQITASITQINSGAEQQSAATHQTSSALAQIEASAAVAERNAETAGERINALEMVLKEGRANVETLITGVSIAREAASDSLKILSKLETFGRRIEKIVDAIGLVALQTTMLSVSGSVEAARAGASGRGFSVVSKDIRALAQQASSSIDAAKDTVRGILAQLAVLQRDFDLTVAETDREVESNAEVLRSLGQLDDDVRAMRKASEEIKAGAQAILNATTQMSEASRQVSAAAEEASGAARQAATAAAQQSQGAEDLAAAVEEIASLAETLKQQNA